MSPLLFGLAVKLDRLRERVDNEHRRYDAPCFPPPEYSWDDKARNDLIRIGNIFQEQANLLAVNLERGLSSSTVQIAYDPDNFVGLAASEFSAAKQTRQMRERSECFSFEDLQPGGGLHLVAMRDSQAIDDFQLLRSDSTLLGKWNDLLINCCSAVKDHRPIDAGRIFFNEYQSRLTKDPLIKGDKLCAESIALDLTKTNFGYEVCTNYVWDGTRSIVTDPKTGAPVPSVKKKYEDLRSFLRLFTQNCFLSIKCWADQHRRLCLSTCNFGMLLYRAAISEFVSRCQQEVWPPSIKVEGLSHGVCIAQLAMMLASSRGKNALEEFMKTLWGTVSVDWNVEAQVAVAREVVAKYVNK